MMRRDAEIRCRMRAEEEEESLCVCAQSYVTVGDRSKAVTENVRFMN